jgi:hypothetical protein
MTTNETYCKGRKMKLAIGYYVAKYLLTNILVYVYRSTWNPDTSETLWASVHSSLN